jgi:hypothetical protein
MLQPLSMTRDEGGFAAQSLVPNANDNVMLADHDNLLEVSEEDENSAARVIEAADKAVAAMSSPTLPMDSRMAPSSVPDNFSIVLECLGNMVK